MSRLVFFPGAGGDGQFWQPVAECLAAFEANQVLLDWPGFGQTPVDPAVESLSDLVGYALEKISQPAEVVGPPSSNKGQDGFDLIAQSMVSEGAREAHGGFDLIAQSMGGVVAVLLALQQPEAIRRLVLCGTSGGIDLTRFEAADWRQRYVAEIPDAPRLFVDDSTDVDHLLESIKIPTLLLWGQDDQVSPVAVGEYLAEKLQNAKFVTIPDAGHDFALKKPQQAAEEIQAFLRG